MSIRCDNCRKQIETKRAMDGLLLCVECGCKIDALKAQKNYWEVKQQIAIINQAKNVQYNQQEIEKKLKDYFDSKDFKQSIANFQFLTKKERVFMEQDETNWQSYILSFLIKAGLINESNLLIRSWKVKGLNQSVETRDEFCNKTEWTKARFCRDKHCWSKDQTEFDAVIKDRNGNYLAVFEYEDQYKDCCQEFCNLIKLAESLKSQEEQPVFCLFYWLPNGPEKNDSMECLDWYIKFITVYMMKITPNLKFLLIVFSGPDDKPYSIDKVTVIDTLNLKNYKNIL